MELKKVIDQRRNYLVKELISYGYFKALVGNQLYELSLVGLEFIHVQEKSQFGKQMNIGELRSSRAY
ncbi:MULTISPECIES: Fur-regulated basic protein FbpA [Priestia]|jgi:hypothetical protein|uniref:Fur-regulated basic protein FbpA n=1 Tax=Priestia TaxID=2800373 RepID=UPI0018A2E2CC|nr:MULTISPECIES: Fur-regulated basic protein FbpA [Priestia]MDR7241378.1 hypothetical protein [Priestia megaterium]QTL51690.1 Fur-regulated basic protein FbpA [Priestia aryabhattai]